MDDGALVGLEVAGLTKIYSDIFVAVDHVSFSLNKGICAVLGPNGAGKSTTLLMIAGLVKPTSGAIRFAEEINKEGVKYRQHLGFLPESYGTFRSLSGIDHIIFTLMIRCPNLEKDAIYHEALTLLTWVGIDKAFWTRPTRTYSQGMKQRLGLAQAFAGNPKLVILDEPMANLDPIGREEIMALIKEKSRQSIILFSTQIISEIEQLADEVMIISRGKIHVSGNLLALCSNEGIIDYEVIIDDNRNIANDENKINKIETLINTNKENFEVEGYQRITGSLIIQTRNPVKFNNFLREANMFSSLHPIKGSLVKIYKKYVGK